MNDNTINTEVTMRDEVPAGGARRFRAGDEILGRYVVESELGQGGMGVVYLCLDKVGGVKVAVKGLPPEVSHNADEMESVRENFQLVSELQHPNIAGVRTLEKDAKTGDYYLVMAYARGVSLKHWLRQHGGKEHRGEQLKVLRQIAAALDYAHNAEPRHIIHRDIKPENIMVDERGSVSVLDFGLAAQVRSSMSRVSQLVTSRSGTPAYKSPEQWLAQAQRAPSDQYSLGVIAYQMFADELPYDSDDIEILKHAVVFDPVPEISGESKATNAVFAKALAKKPQERFASCGDFVAALGGTRSVASAAKPRFAAVLLLTLAVASLVGGGWWWRERVKSEELRVKNEVLAADRTAVPTVPVAPSVSEVVQVPKPVVDDDSDRRRQAEVAKLATTRTKIAIKVAAAKDDYAKVAPYRSEREGFESHLAEIDRQWETVEGVRNPKTLAEAEKTLAAVSEAADAIAFELNWLATNRDGRDAAKRIEKEIVDELEPKLREFKADDVAKSKYGKGQGERQAAAQALARGEFASARRQYETAKATLSAAIADARQFHVKTALAVANEYKAAAQWQKCNAEAGKVLGWEPQNAEALALKQEAESHLVPTLRIVAKVGDREVSATAMFDGKSCTSPWRWEENVKPDSRVPGSDVAVEYAEGGKRYVGTIKPVTVDWKGPKTVVVALTEYRGPKPGDTQTITLPGGATMEMVWCPPGSFMMGSPSNEEKRGSDETQHEVTLTRGFWMGKYEVTQRQWESVMGENPSCFKGADRPVEKVSWEDCQTFIRKVNASGQVCVSLPTEAQWEYACRAGTTTPYSFGSSLNGDKANCDGNYPYGTTVKGRYREETAPVGSYAPNPWGFYDMHGNVWEWCEDWYGDYLTGSVTDPAGPASGAYRVNRGGGWCNDARGCRSALRYRGGPGGRGYDLGFRLVCSAGPRR